jgi:hypothetical protein
MQEKQEPSNRQIITVELTLEEAKALLFAARSGYEEEGFVKWCKDSGLTTRRAMDKLDSAIDAQKGKGEGRRYKRVPPSEDATDEIYG